MRQAGRYLPAYRQLREGVSFLAMCQDVDRAVEVSLQPIEHVGTEAVILFSDIFVPIPAMGVELEFAPGPVIAQPIRSRAQVDALRIPDCRESVPYVFEILGRLRRELESRQIPLLGFAGAPFTLAAYLVEGSGSRDFSTFKRLMHREPETVRALLDRLATLVTDYLAAQVEAGAQVVQLFDTWAGLLSRADYRAFVLPWHQRIAAGLAGTDTPLILYVNNCAHLVDLMADSGAAVLSLDWRCDLAAAAAQVGDRVSLQGNLDPCALAAPPAAIEAMVRELAEAGRSARGHILNLGHGCLPDTPVEGVRAFTEAARTLAR
jgi:uroporphyrinogen decarboxylase